MRRLTFACAILWLLIGSVFTAVVAPTTLAQTPRMVVPGADTLPTTCGIREIFFKTSSNSGLYECLVANTWSDVGGGGGATTPGGANGSIQFNSAGSFGGFAPGTGIVTALGVNVGSAGAPVLFNGAGGTPSSIVLSSATGLPISTGVTGLGANIATALGTSVGSAGSVVVNGGVLGTPSSGTATNLTGTAAGLTAGVASAVALNGITGLGANVATALAIAIGSAGAPVLFNGAGGTPSSIVLTNATGTAAGLTAGTASAAPVAGITGLGTGVVTALGVAIGSAGSFITNGGAAGTPSSIVLTNATGTAASLTAGIASAVAVGGITGLGTGVATWLATPSSANLITAVTGETGTGALTFATSPTFATYLNMESTGVRFSATNGVLTFLGLGNGADLQLVLDFNTSSNFLGISSNGTATDLDARTMWVEVLGISAGADIANGFFDGNFLGLANTTAGATYSSGMYVGSDGRFEMYGGLSSEGFLDFYPTGYVTTPSYAAKWVFVNPVITEATFQPLGGYKSADGTAGISGATCSLWKDGLCVTP